MTTTEIGSQHHRRWLLADVLGGIGMALTASAFVVAGKRAAGDAIAKYGYNVDSGAYHYIAALCLVPGAFLLAFAAVAHARRWAHAELAQWVAVVFTVLPLLLLGWIVLAGRW